MVKSLPKRSGTHDEFINSIELLTDAARSEFGSALDYVWKAPTLIKELRRIELKKLREYFPEGGITSQLRWQIESSKLHLFFPVMIAHGNLFAVSSLFESYLLYLAHELEKYAIHRLKQCSGQGAGRCLTYFRLLGINTQNISLWPQVDAALKIRNCLIHAHGDLKYSRTASEIRQIVKSRTFLAQEVRQRIRDDDVKVRIDCEDKREHLEITNYYAWMACAYFRDYFLELAAQSTVIVSMQKPDKSVVSET